MPISFTAAVNFTASVPHRPYICVAACAESGAFAPAQAVAPMPVVPVTLSPEVADPPSAVAVPFGTDRPYGTPVPGGILIGADMSLQLKVCCLSSIDTA